jgi:phosphoribosyl-ATP pyrophosphohydrolase
MLASRDVQLVDVMAELAGRQSRSGVEEKASR